MGADATLAMWASGAYTPMAMIAAACARQNAGPDVEHVIVITSDQAPSACKPSDVLIMRDTMTGPAHHYVRKPLWWAELLGGCDVVVGLDADAIVLGDLSEAINETGGVDFVSVMSDSSYMPKKPHMRASCGVDWARSDVLSRLDLCPDKGASLRSFFRLPSDEVLNRSAYFSVAFMFMRSTSATIQTMRRTAEYGIKVPQARHFSVWPENTPMNCAAIEADTHWSELNPAMYSSTCAHEDKRIWHMDGHKPGRSLRSALGGYVGVVEASCRRQGLDLAHPYFKETW